MSFVSERSLDVYLKKKNISWVLTLMKCAALACGDKTVDFVS
jgi:hypothetical protein